MVADPPLKTVSGPLHEEVFPAGWFAACLVSELPKGGVLLRTLMGRPTLLTRTPAGQLVCARVPARLLYVLRRATWQDQQLVGPGVSLRLEGTSLLAADGPALDCLPVQVFHGVLLFWSATKNSNLQPFALPDWPNESMTPYKFRYYPRAVNTTVKEITEDIADTVHFGEGGHRWKDLEIQRFDTSTAVSTLDMAFTMETSVFGRFRDQMRFAGHFDAVGVGFFIGSVRSDERDLEARPLICYTPTTSPRRIQLIYGESHRRMTAPWRLNRLLGLIPRRMVDTVVSMQALRAMDKDVEHCDVRRWETENYLKQRRGRTDPLLEDYRRWVARFYGEFPTEQRARVA